MKKLSFFAPVAAIALAMPLSLAYAAEVQAGKTVSIPGTQTISENAYLAGGQVNVAAPAEKDLLVAGGKILINAPVSGDLMLAGGTIDVLGKVAGDLRIAGGEVIIHEAVGGDVIVFGGTVTLLPGALVAGDVVVFGGIVDIQSAVAGSLDVRADDVAVNSSIAGPVSIQAGTAVSFGANAALGGTLSYSAPKEADIAEGAELGNQVVFTEQGSASSDDRNMVAGFLAVLGALMFVKFLGMLAAALLITYAFKNALHALSLQAIQKFWQMAGIGFVVTVLAPIAIFLLLISVIGMFIGFALAALYLFALLIAGIFMCILAGAFLSQWIKKEVRIDWIWTLFGTAAVFLLSFVPIIGWALTVILFFASMGAVATSMWQDAKAKMHAVSAD